MNKSILADRIQNMSESATLKMTRLSRELKAQGVDIITLSIGEPDFDTPRNVKDAAKKAIEDNITHYTPVPGFPALRQAIANKLKRDNGLDYIADQIVVSNGAKQSIANIFMSILNKGDEVIVPSPYWVSYPEMIKMADGEPVIIHAGIESDFKIKPEQIETAITPKTKAIIFSAPSNPTGSLYTKQDLKAIAAVLKAHPDVLLISDEIYELIVFSGKHVSIASFEEIKEQVVIVNGVSKGFAMTGWRIGYIAAPQFLAAACNKFQGQYTSGASSISQMAAIEALNTLPEESPELMKMVSAFKERRDLLIRLVKEIPGFKTNTPEGAFYLFPDVSDYFGKSNGDATINNSTDLCLYLLDKAHVALVPGEAFGAEDCIRISYATSKDNIEEAVNRIAKACINLN
jgi:aspartate aminotransferase